MHKLDELVKDMLNQHIGGETFFDHLDEAIKNNENIVDALIETIPDIEQKNIIVSGKFGRFFRKYLSLININPKSIIYVRGGLRTGASAKGLQAFDLSSKEYIFIDDSFYSGKTRDTIKEELVNNNAKLIETYVVYDGSYKKENNVYSLYRYYN